MKKTLIVSCIALFAFGTPVQAQSGQPATGTKVTMQDEIMTISAELKEAYGILSQDLAHLSREIGPDATAATPEQAAMRDRMKTALIQLEGILTTVNTADEGQWEAVQAKSSLVREQALGLVKERSESK